MLPHQLDFELAQARREEEIDELARSRLLEPRPVTTQRIAAVAIAALTVLLLALPGVARGEPLEAEIPAAETQAFRVSSGTCGSLTDDAAR